MSNRAQEVLQAALRLPREERADVAAELLSSLDEQAIDDPDAVQAAWAREIERRARRALSGESEGAPWSVVRERISRKFGSR